MPLDKVLVLLSVTMLLPPGTTVAGAKVTVDPAGTPAVAVRITGTTYPPTDVVPKVTAALLAALQAMVVAAGELNKNVLGGTAIVKLVLEMSKNIFPTDSTLILARVVGVFGMVTNSVPSLAVLAANTVGKVRPPSTDNKILTLAQLTGAAVVPLTDQVTA